MARHGDTTNGACDGRRLLAALESCAAWLDAHRAAVDALNVYPVPDGDTGTNMAMTLDAALREARMSPAHDAATIAERAAYGALMGARGNSGVILSQLLRGFARALDGQQAIGPAELAAALAQASETAARAVMKPVEGTILTVAAAAARAAGEAADAGLGVAAVLDTALAEARAAVARTPEQLAILAQAGVVDAGGQGYALILEGASRYLHGQPAHPLGAAASSALHVPLAHAVPGEDYGYCTEFILVGQHLDPTAIRDAIATLGDSTLVVGEEGIVRVHVHTEDPGRVLSYAAPLGRLHKIKIESMQEQHERYLAQPGTPTSDTSVLMASANAEPVAHTGVVAVAPGEGLAQVFRSLGAQAVVRGGQTMNPSTEELLAAVDGVPHESVLVLPNNRNVRLAAEQARGLARKAVTIVPAQTVPQGLAALVAYDPEADLERNAAAMEAAMAGVRTGEVTIAVRDASFDGLSVRAGQVLGLLDGQAVMAGSERDAVALELIERMGAGEGEIATVYYGAGVTRDEAQALVDSVSQRYPHLQVEVIAGGQPHYPYIISME